MDLRGASIDELFTLARASENEDAYWDCVAELHGRPEERTFKLAEVLCESFTAGERCLGADVLGQLGAPDPPFADAGGAVLLRMLQEEDEPAVLASAAVGLGHMRDARAIGRLAELASHFSPAVRRAVVHGLMGHDDDRAVAALIALSADPDEDVRDWATFALAVQIDRDDPELRQALAVRLEDSNLDARAEAIRGLARRGDERALEAALAAAGGADAQAPAMDEAIELLAQSTNDPRLRPHLDRIRSEDS